MFLQNEFNVFLNSPNHCDYYKLLASYKHYHNEESSFVLNSFGAFLKSICDNRIKLLVEPLLVGKTLGNIFILYEYGYSHTFFNSQCVKDLIIPYLIGVNPHKYSLQYIMESAYFTTYHKYEIENSQFLAEFWGKVVKVNRFNDIMENSPYYGLHRSNLITYGVNLSHYKNFLNTSDVEEYALLTILIMTSFFLFFYSLLGLIISRLNLVIFLLFTELFLFSSIFLLIIFSIYLELPFGQVYALLLLGVAAAEAAVGLGLLLVVYRIRGYLAFK